MVGLEPRDLKDLRERKVTRVKLDLPALLATMENTAREDRWGPKVKRVSLESKEDRDQGVHQVWRDQKAILAHPVSPAILESRDLVGSRGSLAIPGTTAGRETGAFKATPGLLVSRGYRDLPGNQ